MLLTGTAHCHAVHFLQAGTRQDRAGSYMQADNLTSWKSHSAGNVYTLSFHCLYACGSPGVSAATRLTLPPTAAHRSKGVR